MRESTLMIRAAASDVESFRLLQPGPGPGQAAGTRFVEGLGVLVRGGRVVVQEIFKIFHTEHPPFFFFTRNASFFPTQKKEREAAGDTVRGLGGPQDGETSP
jgi:hypothetical protein